MKRRRAAVFAALAAGMSLIATACSGGIGTGAGYNSGLTKVVDASKHTGGTVTYGLTSTPDSTDPGNTYYAYMWDFSRLYARTMLTYKNAPGKAGTQLVPDIATGPGQTSDNGLTWTYHIKPDIKFEDGTTVNTQDIKYAIERSNYAPDVLPNGPTYFHQLLADPSYPGPYKDPTPDKLGLTSIDTPDPTTIIFHLQQPFADFNYLMTMPDTSPVPPVKDTGASYQNHPLATGPYKFSKFDPNTGFTLTRNPDWNGATDPVREQLASQIVVDYNINATDLDNRLLSGSIDIDMDGTGVQAAARAKVLTQSQYKSNADDALSDYNWYAALNTQVAPLNNIHCRLAVEYGADKVADQTAYGGPVAGGDIASTVLPPSATGYTPFDLYEANTQQHGDLTKARQELALCGQPDGFTTSISARSDRPKEIAAAQAIQQALAKIGIKTNIEQYPTGQYFSDFAGVPNYVHQHDLGILMMGWAADWPTGYGYLEEIADGNAIKPAGNSNLSEENNPQVNALLAQAMRTPDESQRNQIYGQIDKITMRDAVILPEVYARSLLYRNPKTTNVYVQQAYGMYDYTQIGVSS